VLIKLNQKIDLLRAKLEEAEIEGSKTDGEPTLDEPTFNSQDPKNAQESPSNLKLIASTVMNREQEALYIEFMKMNKKENMNIKFDLTLIKEPSEPEEEE